MILPALVCVLRLKEQVGARYDSGAIYSSEPFPDSSFEVVPPLIGRIDAAEARAQRELGEGLGTVFLPGGAVEKPGNGDRIMGWHCAILPR